MLYLCDFDCWWDIRLPLTSNSVERILNSMPEGRGPAMHAEMQQAQLQMPIPAPQCTPRAALDLMETPRGLSQTSNLARPATGLELRFHSSRSRQSEGPSTHQGVQPVQTSAWSHMQGISTSQRHAVISHHSDYASAHNSRAMSSASIKLQALREGTMRGGLQVQSADIANESAIARRIRLGSMTQGYAAPAAPF